MQCAANHPSRGALQGKTYRILVLQLVSIGPPPERRQDGPAKPEGRLPVTAVWTALAIETGTALVIAGSLAAWARRHFRGSADAAPADIAPADAA